MVVPTLLARREELGNPVCFRINAREVRAFVEITVNASQRQIIEIIAAVMEFREDVFDVENGQR